MAKKFPSYIQLDMMDCGPSCVKIISEHYGKRYSLQYLREQSYITREGVSLLGISDAAEAVGFRTIGVKTTFEQLANEAPLPFIAHWNQQHFIVVHKITKKKVHVSDPAVGLVTYDREQFMKHWASTREQGEDKGVALLMEPTPEFFQRESDEKLKKTSWKFLLGYVLRYKKFLVQLFLGLLLGSLLSMIFPFLTQSVVDIGINTRDLNFIYIVLLGQFMLFFSQTAVDFIRRWILLHLSTRINISLISDFLIKLMKLPIGFFDTKMIGDLLQRINDHHRIERFLSTSTLTILFSFFNLIVFGFVLAYYNLYIFLIFLIGSILYIGWVLAFLNIRKKLDYKRFQEMSRNQSSLIHLINGMQEIKLNNCEKQKRWEWERIQAKMFKINVKSVTLEQTQQAGSLFINQSKNILITFFAAYAVVNGTMTLGMMLAVQSIIGQLDGPITQMISFVYEMQDAKISLERLGEIHEKEEEESSEGDQVTILPEGKNLHLDNITFQYEGPHSPKVIDGVTLTIPEGKITAIVGTSGSGKTTLLKLLLKFYPVTEGEIKLEGIQLNNLSGRLWRERCGTVMQDGFIFSDTIARNIAVSDEIIDQQRLRHAVQVANIQEFVEDLPLGYNTKIGQDGIGVSGGQKQRVLIARAVYKNPEFLFFDEATSALDANNERIIMENLDEFFKGKTAVVIAHRLSTVKNADQIIVLEKGKLVEQGTHKELTAKKGIYYNLVKNQLELGG
ncbi:peptidase domain-containing ABC transporter [uncultured Microscilla sp.]|uniref:peptidase domain-containing ABC transporter n=1 Tax=uncultured Microscilla sp. TaxID=432653 RepID=UPI002605CFD7|nr:peptidase domain-containing ABC transporter [uncultured Microscilla sp.]